MLTTETVYNVKYVQLVEWLLTLSIHVILNVGGRLVANVEHVRIRSTCINLTYFCQQDLSTCRIIHLTLHTENYSIDLQRSAVDLQKETVDLYRHCGP